MTIKSLLAATMMFAAITVSAKTTPSETLKVWIDDFTITANGETVAYLKVYESDIVDYTAFNMTFQVPVGLKIHKVKQGREMVDDITLSERAAATHTISCALWSDGTTLRVISTSTKNDDFYPDDEDGNPLNLLYTIGLTADPDMANGSYTIEMTGIKFVLANGDACVLPDDHVYGTVTVTGSTTTGLEEEVTVDEIDSPCSDVLGRIVHNPAPGTIVIYKNRKVLIK